MEQKIVKFAFVICH